MSALASPDYNAAQSPVFFHDSRYQYHHCFAEEAAILALPVRRPTARAGMLQGLRWLGQHCADQKNRGYLTKLETNQVWASYGITRDATRRAWRKRLVESGALIAHPDGYQLRSYARFNRSPEEWEAERIKRAKYQADWVFNKRAEARSIEERDRLLESVANSESAHIATTFNILEGVDSHHIEQCESEPPPPSLSPEGVAPPGPTPTPGFPKQSTTPTVPLPKVCHSPNEPLPKCAAQTPLPLRATSLGVCLAPQQKRENQKQNRGASGSARAYPDPKAGKAKPGESKARIEDSEFYRMVQDAAAKHGVVWGESAKQGMPQ